MSDWVKVSDRLPDKDGYYIIFAPSEDPHSPLLVGCWWHGDHWGLVDQWREAVTHWMPPPSWPVDYRP